MSSPAARNSAWRFGFDTPTNYNDSELFCGGREVGRFRKIPVKMFSVKQTGHVGRCSLMPLFVLFSQVQHRINGGRCGVCGDDWRLPEPRPHERGGRFGRGVVTANYSEGQVVPVTIHISANHEGFYEFRLCSNNDPSARDSQECLDEHFLAMAEIGGHRYTLAGSIHGDHTVQVKLPKGVACTHCVLQWKWTVDEPILHP
ncbi:uncharacterized protein LOC119594474 isoform X2 [Penaeus monodon]|uniref:uncharacterized protein LOC119594474 isoform X2 n=1 Tax=Penaeus monodon TaxID=6687 RepID=UPI0018A7B218|nr:uncharacterized protein LOC119594474 isoform X2 [Penaeus monodon]